MRVQRMLMPDGSESWTVLDARGGPVPAVEGFLAHLQALDRSPATVRTYATSLKLWLQFLNRLGVSRFVAWLRAPAENVTALAGGAGRCGPATVNKRLSRSDRCCRTGQAWRPRPTRTQGVRSRRLPFRVSKTF